MPGERARGHKKTCKDKQAFDSESKAEAAAYRPRRLLAAHGFMKAYKCFGCKKWHYGHPKGFK